MASLYRSSPFEGGGVYSVSDKRRRFAFYLNLLSQATCSASILYLARHIKIDPCLFSHDREWLYKCAEVLFRDMEGYDMEDNS